MFTVFVIFLLFALFLVGFVFGIYWSIKAVIRLFGG